jgi:hypothetical protein
VHHRAGDHDPLRLAAGHVVGLVVPALAQAEQLEQLVGAAVALCRRHAMVGGVEDQVLPDRERAVEVRPLRHDGQMGPRPHRIAGDVDAAHPGDAARAPHPRREDADGRRLARAVGAQEPEDLAALDAERDPVDGVHGSLRVALDEALHLHRRPALARNRHRS